ncbi:TIGR01244 family sulfur transferase [Sphingomonas daechungensis]|uniref:TIGR01244 family phosphatase n=1 Tax=Sphingomonas daechungensis TaxID=1176646 RepID=A0ABX6T2R2_9SPHN|nr:TIGR01244 family sulfur transferase [Sphingomonas daechungensis]QNP44156.1 TIGR01244 family phosphatase [Sphingomonas daechungensis]
MTRQLDDVLSVSGQVQPGDIAALAGEGITLIINNRPDGEEPGQPRGLEIEQAATAAGIAYRAVPIIRGIGPADADAMNDALAAASGKVLAFCRSGTRSALTWALAKADKGMPRDEIERRLVAVGVDPTPIAHLL